MDGGRDHTLAIFRASAAMLFAAWVVVIVGLGERYGRDHGAPARVAASEVVR